MTGTQAIRTALQTSQQVLDWFLADLSDADLLVRPVPGANHIAWQLGHLLLAERRNGQNLPGAEFPELPPGFEQQHSKETSAVDPPVGFLSKAEYVALLAGMRRAILAALDKASDADLDRPIEGPRAALAPTVGAMALLVASHAMLHAGQFSAVRRKLGKPVLF